MTFVDHFLAELVPTAVMGVLAVAAFVTYSLVLFLVGVWFERRRRQRAWLRREAAYQQQIEETVPMATGQGGDR